MAELEFLGKIKMVRLTSLDEDLKESRRQFRQDEEDRDARRKGLNQVKSETSYERLNGEIHSTSKPTLDHLLQSKQLIPASQLQDEILAKYKAQAEFDDAVLSEQSLRKSKVPRSIKNQEPTFTREPFED